MNSTLAALALLAVAAGPGALRTGSAQFQVAVRVVTPLRARAPAVLELGGPTPAVAAEVKDGVLVARFAPTAAVGGGAGTVLVGLPGGELRACGRAVAGECEVALPATAAADPASAVVVAAFVPDGAATRIVAR